jgi:outer membrane protein OmpA-like peptidoglycan-associated protein
MSIAASRTLPFGCAMAALALLASGCATAPPAGTAPAAPHPGAHTTPRAAVPTALATEQRFLEDWFKGTPVRITLQGSGPLVVEVPLAHSFEAGATTLKPALAAVLDRVAESLRRQGATRVLVAAPADAGAAATQAQLRMVRVREHLTARGVAATRVGLQPASTAVAGVQLRIALVAAPVMRLDDADLPAAPFGTKGR